MSESVLNLREVLMQKQRELDEREWEGHAPEKLQSLIMEINNMKWLESQGDVWYPLF